MTVIGKIAYNSNSEREIEEENYRSLGETCREFLKWVCQATMPS